MLSRRPRTGAEAPLQAGLDVASDAGSGGGQFVDEGDFAALPVKLARYGQARHRAEAILSFLGTIGNGSASRCPATRSADRLRDCGNYLLFHHYHTADRVRLHAAHLCQQHLLCPLCAIRRASKQVGAYLPRFEAITAAAPHLRPVVITYTVKNGADLGERMAHLRSGLQTLTKERRQVRGRGKAGSCTWGHLAGAVGALEVTWSKRHGWHPHMHMIGLCDGWMDQREMSAEWRRITGDSFVVGIQRLDPARAPADAFCEVLKYAVKFGGLPPARVWEAAQALSGRRLIFSLGAFRGVDVPESLLDEPLEGLPFVELLFRYLGGGHYGLSRRQRYVLCQSPPGAVDSQISQAEGGRASSTT